MTWLALGDWGTTRLRLYRIEDGKVTDRVEGPGALNPQPEAVLRAALEPWCAQSRPAVIRLAGMAGARTGLREAPYAECPADVEAWRRSTLSFEFDGAPLTIASGLACTHEDGAADVMRGEETQIFGALALEPSLRQGRHLFVLPGTHSKWVTVQEGRIVRFNTFVTGELFALLRGSSLLSSQNEPNPALEVEGFAAGLARAREGSLLLPLFEARAAQLRQSRSPDWASGFLSGLLIGGEIAEARRASDHSASVQLLGAPDLSARYEQALKTFDVEAHHLDDDVCVRHGLGLL